ncbi:MAG TPA: MBL fold metallo-hydrolase [Acidimicrobiales bacterium]|nr:MBL fold metallo-hydrolase [Acidimicrobiales bacterium]
MITSYSPMPGVDVLTTAFPVPGFGLIPVNAFVLHGEEPVLVDTGAVVLHDEFWHALGTVIDPQDIRWIWLSHTDADHIGTLHRLLGEFPGIRVITTFLGVGILSTSAPLPMDRVHLLNPGERLSFGDRCLTAFRPPVFDNPSTTGFVDDRTGLLFTSDCFGALLQDVPQDAADIPALDLHQGQVMWTTIDSPWVHMVDRARFAAELGGLREMDPTMVLGSHLPAAPGRMLSRLVDSLESVPDAQPFSGPDQAALEQMLATMTGDAAR